jgi:thiol:disulfide interchange protein
VPVTVKQADKGATLTVTWQGCADAGFCYPPETKVIPLSAVLAASAMARRPPSTLRRRRASSGVQPAAAG